MRCHRVEAAAHWRPSSPSRDSPVTLPTRLLIADHGTSRLREALRPLEALGLELVPSSTRETTMDLIQRGQVELLIVERDQLEGLDRDQLPQALARPRPIPLLLVSGNDDAMSAIIAGRSMRGIPWDLVREDAPIEEFLLRAEQLLERADVLHQLDKARYQASHDDLTGLLRPRPFGERLREHFSATQRHRLELALILIDLDDFGRVNKDFDHTVGDEVISRAGETIRTSLREEDIGGRLGGDEFALILPFTSRVDAARVVARLAARIRGLSGPPSGLRPSVDQRRGDPRRSIRVSASLGFETYDGGDLGTLEELRLHAEQALHAAKGHGGNQGMYFRSLEPNGDRGAAAVGT